MGATASGGVTFMRVLSSLIPSTCSIACLLFAWTNFHISFAIANPTHANEKSRCVTLAQHFHSPLTAAFTFTVSNLTLVLTIDY